MQNTLLSKKFTVRIELNSFLSKLEPGITSKCFFTTFGEAHGEPDWRIAPAGNYITKLY